MKPYASLSSDVPVSTATVEAAHVDGLRDAGAAGLDDPRLSGLVVGDEVDVCSRAALGVKLEMPRS